MIKTLNVSNFQSRKSAGLKIIHLADIHARDKNLAEIEKCLDFIVETAKNEKPDIIINAGDTFDSQNIKLDSPSAKMIFRIFSELADIAPVATVIGTPSHDGQAAEVLKYIKAKHNIWISNTPEQICLHETEEGNRLSNLDWPITKAVISMCPAPTKQFFDVRSDIKGTDNEIAQAMSNIFTGFAAQASKYGAPHILVGHWNVTSALISDTQTLTGVDIEISKEQMALPNADLICLGHIHKAQQIGENIFFSGSPQNNTWGEMSTPGFYIHELDKNGLTSRFIPTPSTKRLRINNDFTEENGLTDITMPDGIQGAIIRHDIKVFQDEAVKIDAEQIRQKFITGGANEVEINIIRIPRGNTRSKTILTLDRLRDKLIEKATLNGGEIVPESILIKADLLETETSERIVEIAANSKPQTNM